MFGLYKKEQKKQTLASTILRLCLAFQLVASCAWSPSFAEATEAAKPAANATATIDSAEKVEKIKIASVDSVIEDEKQEKKKKSKLKPVKLPKAEAKLIAVADAKDATAGSADGKAIACKGECKDDATKADASKTETKDDKSSEATDGKDAKSKRRWFGLGKTEEEKAIAEAKYKAEAEAQAKAEAEQAKKWADEKEGKKLAKKAAAEAKAKAKAEKKATKAEDKETKAEAPATEAAATVNLPAAPAAAPVAPAAVPASPSWTEAAVQAPAKDATQPVAAQPTAPATTQTAPATSGDGKLVATKAPIAETTTPAQKPAGQNFSGEGIGGFVSATDQKELSFLQEGRVEETIGDLNVIVIDNDEVVEMEQTIAYEELPTDEGKTRIKTGAQFPVMLSSQLSSETAKEGDIIQGRLKYDLKIGNKVVAKKGDLVRGRVSYRMKARSVMHSLVSPNRWYRNSGVLGLTFDEIITGKGEHIALNAKPARKGNIIKNKAEGRLLGVNHNGEITGPWAQQLRWKAVRIGLNAAMAPVGVFSFGAMPVALGVMGAVNPSFAFMKPVGTNVPHRRIKGFFWGALSGVPGSWIIEDTVTKGQPCILKPGDEFLVELQQEFTGEAVTSAQMLPGAGANVSSEVEGATKKNTVKGKKTKKK